MKTRFEFRPIWLAYLGMLGFLSYLHPALDWMSWFFAFSILYLIWLVIDGLRSRKQPAADLQEAQAFDPPLPGPAQRSGMTIFWLRYGLSLVLCFLNPFQLFQMLGQMIGQIQAEMRVKGQLPTPETYLQQARYRLPFEGEWLIYNGGLSKDTSHSWDIYAQRYAYDFVKSGKELLRHDAGQGNRLTDYYCYGQAIVSPADGTVVEVRDRLRDAPGVGTGWLDWLAVDIRGNFIVIRHADAEYSTLAHLMPGSIKVQAGEQVQAGQIIGRCGNSGHSTEPHLHFHVTDKPGFFTGIGLPVRFDGVRSHNEIARDEMALRSGMLVRPHQAGNHAG